MMCVRVIMMVATTTTTTRVQSHLDNPKTYTDHHSPVSTREQGDIKI